MNQQEWLDTDSELVLAYIRKLKQEFKDEPSIATVVNGAMIRAEHCGLFSQSRTTLGDLKKSTGPAANTNAWGEKPITCPDCGSTVAPSVSKYTGKAFYRCDTCTGKYDEGVVFINRDGKTAHVIGDKR